MTEKQWQILLNVIDGKINNNIPVGFIIDCPWLPGWFGMSTIDYFSSDKHWLEANFKAVDTFADVIFLPGFWSEYGMCTEPSAFGARQVWYHDNMPHADKIIYSTADIDKLKKPNPKTDGLLPFMLNRLRNCRRQIEAKGHQIKFAVARGPLNIASFLMGTTEFLTAMKLEPEKTHKLLNTITEFLVDWLSLQKESIDTIDGIFLLDDIMGFVGDDDFKEFALPYIGKIYSTLNCRVNFLHNDADGLVTSKYLNQMGVNLFNFAFKHSICQIQQLTGGKVAMLGNIPPRDVLANGSAEDIKNATEEILSTVNSDTRLILSCGGGMPQGVSTENIKTFINCAIQA